MLHPYFQFKTVSYDTKPFKGPLSTLDDTSSTVAGHCTEPEQPRLQSGRVCRVQNSPWLGDDCSSCSLRRMLPPLEGRWWWCFFLFLMRIFPISSCGEGSGCPGSSWSQTKDTTDKLSGWWHFETRRRKNRVKGFSQSEMARSVRAEAPSLILIMNNYPGSTYWTTLIFNRHHVVQTNLCFRHKI